MELTQRIGLLWRMMRLLPQLDAIEPDLEEATTSKEKQADIALKIGIINKNQHNRIKLLWKLIQVSDQAIKVEDEWRRIQQDEHDEFFRYQIYKGSESDKLAYKRGIVDGIKWCVERFS